jgi:hypothetical protein
MNKLNIKWTIIVAMILVAAAFRILPHFPNATPVAAMGLFAAAYLRQSWQAFLIPFFAMIVSDIYVYSQNDFATYPLNSMLFNSFFTYIAFGLAIFMGQKLLKKVNVKNVIVSTLLGSLIFFVVSNLGVFAEGILYPKTFAGLFDCFFNAIPFYKNTWVGDLAYSAILFGTFELVKMKMPVLAKA